MANPMPPPSTIPPDTVSVTKNLVKENLSPSHSVFNKDPNATNFDNSGVSSVTRTTSKTTQSKVNKTQRTYISDGLETGSDSDVVEDAGGSYGYPYDKYPSPIYDVPVMINRPLSKGKKYVFPLKPTKEDVSGRDGTNQSDLLANYETPFLSEFTRRLSSRSLINTSPSPSTLLGSKSKGVS